jgi:hypothetical protein
VINLVLTNGGHGESGTFGRKVIGSSSVSDWDELHDFSLSPFPGHFGLSGRS